MIDEIELTVDKAEIEVAIRQHFKNVVDVDLNEFIVGHSDLNMDKIVIRFKRTPEKEAKR